MLKKHTCKTIKEYHGCYKIFNINNCGWTFENDDYENSFTLDIDYCPFCGVKLDG